MCFAGNCADTATSAMMEKDEGCDGNRLNWEIESTIYISIIQFNNSIYQFNISISSIIRLTNPICKNANNFRTLFCTVSECMWPVFI